MRSLALLIAAAAMLAAMPAAHARNFWQTYGATVPAPGGGCVWNVNSDYFVPRTCGAGTYDLFSACKKHHSNSPACVSLHPIYGGYCTPFASWHYHRKDHVYKKHCGCTPLKDALGPWHLEKCGKHCGMLRNDAGGCGAVCSRGGSCGDACVAGCNACGEFAAGGYLPNVEPFGGETLGEITALPASMMGGSGGMSGMGGVPQAFPGSAGAAGMPTGGSFPIPGLFGR
jgi:hypothetical protein